MPLYKGLIGSILLTFIGVLSVKLMFFIENGDFSGLSFFGAVLFIPILAVPISVVLNIKYQDYIDICAPSVAIMLSAMKINCLRSGCCIGKVLYTNEFGATVRFPSQIFEMVVAFLICVLLIYASKKIYDEYKKRNKSSSFFNKYESEIKLYEAAINTLKEYDVEPLATLEEVTNKLDTLTKEHDAKLKSFHLLNKEISRLDKASQNLNTILYAAKQKNLEPEKIRFVSLDR